MITTNQKTTIFLAILVSLIFVYFRFYKIDSSLLFFNDIGRDYLVLFNWQDSGKPPLLGPQTSALPYNQSALYFYILFPFFLLLNHSPYATLITLTTFYLGSFWTGLYWARNNKIITQSILAISYAIAIHPQFIAQNRFVWNPSFVAPLIIAGFYFFQQLYKKYSWKYLWLFSLSLAAASAFSYSVIPLFVAWMAYAVVIFGKKSWKLYLTQAFSLVLVNLPTLFFELRHEFFLTKLLINGEKLEQINPGFFDKTKQLLQFSVEIVPWQLGLVLFLVITSLVLLSLIEAKSHPNRTAIRDSLLLFLLTMVLTVIIPVAAQKHYVFPLISLGLLIISFLPKKFTLLCLLVLSGFWLHPTVTKNYFLPVHRTISQTQACAEKLCQQFSQPMFVSVQAGYHPYHNGMEFKYFFKNEGCQVRELDTQIDQASYMVVVVDDSVYQHGKTAYNELTQFGDSSEIDTIKCQDNLELKLLKR